MGNLCANIQNVDELIKTKAMNILVSFSFFPLYVDTTHTQFQALAGIRGLGVSKSLREDLVDIGCIEPLILVAGDERELINNVEKRREAMAALYNLSLSLDNGMKMVTSGVVNSIIRLCGVDDTMCQILAVGTLANLAERGALVQSRLINDGCLVPLINYVRIFCSTVGNVEIKREVFRSLALLALNLDSHETIMSREVVQCIISSIQMVDDCQCRGFIIQLLANLGLFQQNHERLIKGGVLGSLNILVNNRDIVTKRCVAFAIHNLCKNEGTHGHCESEKILRSIALLMTSDDPFTKLHACLASKYITRSAAASAQFVEYEGLPRLLSITMDEDNELKREVVATLRNLSIIDYIKVLIVKVDGIEVLTNFCRASDDKLCQQSCGVIANLAEVKENQVFLMKCGILHHLKFLMRTRTTEVKRECLRAIANLSYDPKCNRLIVIEGGLTHVTQSLSSDDYLCRIYATMSISNLSADRSNHNHIVEEGGLQPLLYIASSGDIVDVSRQYAYFALTNLTATKCHQATLISCGFVSISCPFLKDSDRLMRLSAALCLSNLASNVCNHEVLVKSQCLSYFANALNGSDRDIRFRAVSFLRGLSTNSEMRHVLIREDVFQKLLRLVLSQDVEVQIETLATLCNLSMDGYIGEESEDVNSKVKMKNLVSFLCSSNATLRLFGVVSIGNISSEREPKGNNDRDENLGPLIDAGNNADPETQRCIAYALCNLCTEESNRLPIITEGGLIPLFSLASSNDPCDILTSISAIRGLASSNLLQRQLVTNGCLYPLFASLESSRNKAIVMETLAAVAALSVNYDNKESIVKYSGFSYLLKESITNDVDAAGVAFRILANCSEIIELHEYIIKCMAENPHIMSMYHDFSCVHFWREISRFYSSLCSNTSNIDTIINMNISHQILTIVNRVSDVVIVRNSVLALLNLSVASSCHRHTTLSNSVTNVLFEYACSESKADDNAQIRKYISLAIGNVVRQSEFVENSNLSNLIQTLSRNLKDDDIETRFNASFALHQVSMRRESITYFRDVGIERCLLNYVSEAPLHLLSHAISTMRLVSFDDEISKRIVERDGLQILTSILEDSPQEVKREISAIFCNLSRQPENKLSIVNSVVIVRIINLSDFKDPEISRFSMATIANIAEDMRTHSILLSAADLLHMIVNKISSSNLSLQREASRAASNILSAKTQHKKFLNANGLDVMYQLSRSLDKECQFYASLSFDKLNSNPFNCDDIIQSDILHAVLHLGKGTENIIASRHAISALRGLSSNKAIRELVAEKGGLRVAIDLLNSDDFQLQVLAAETLHYLSVSKRLKFSMCDDGVLEVINKCVIAATNEVLLFHCACALSNISEDPQARKSLSNEEVFQSLALMAFHESERIQCQVVRTYNFISVKTLDKLSKDLAQKLIESSILLLSSPHEAIASEAAKVIGNISDNFSHQLWICKLGALKPLIGLLALSEKCRVNACRAISRIMIPDENKRLCVENKSLLDHLIFFCCSQNTQLLRIALMALCNLSCCRKAQLLMVDMNVVETLLSLIVNQNSEIVIVRSATKTLCNLAIKKETRDRIIHKGGILYFCSLLQHKNVDCIELAIYALNNLCADREYTAAIMKSGALLLLSPHIHDISMAGNQIAAIKMLYNLSTQEECHRNIVNSSIVDSVKLLCKSETNECRNYSMMILANLAANEGTRNEAIRRGGLQSAILMLRDRCGDCAMCACICLANMAHSTLTQTQIVLHGGLSRLAENISKEPDSVLLQSAMMCVVNLAVNESNHNQILDKRFFSRSIELWKTGCKDVKYLSNFIISNLFSNLQVLDSFDYFDGISTIINMANSDNDYYKCLAFASLRKMATSTLNRQKLVQSGILRMIHLNGSTNCTEVKREVSAILYNLSQDASSMLKKEIIRKCLQILIHLIQSNDSITIVNAAGTVGNISEYDEDHSYFRSTNVMYRLMTLITHVCCDIRREASRAICNLFSTPENSKFLIDVDNDHMRSLVLLCGDRDQDCQFYALSSCRNLAVNQKTHKFLLEYGLSNFCVLIKSSNFTIKKKALATLRDLSTSDENKTVMASSKVVEALTCALKCQNQIIQSLVTATLRHLSTVNDSIKREIVESGVLSILIKYINEISLIESLIRQISGLFANLSEFSGNHIYMVDEGIISAILILSKIQNEEIWQDTARTVANLTACRDRQLVIYQQRGMDCLMKMIDESHSVCRRYISMGIKNVCTNVEVCKGLIREKNVSSLLQLSQSQSLDLKRTVATIIVSISNEVDGKIQLTRDGCIQDIIALCTQDDLQIQCESICTLANIADSDENHHKLIYEGAIQVVTRLSQSASDSLVVREISRFFSLISTDDDARHILLEQGIISNLMKFARASDVSTQRYSILTLCNLSLGRSQQMSMLQHHSLMNTLMYLTRCADLEVERCTILTITALTLGANDTSKTKIVETGFLRPLVKMLKYPDNEIRQCIALALSALVIGENDHIKLILKNELHDLNDWCSFLESCNDECIHHGVHIIGSLLESNNLRDSVTRDCISFVSKVATSTTIEVKRVCGYIFSLLVENKHYHDNIQAVGALQQIVDLAGLVDDECQLYGAFSLVHLAGNRDLQVPLVQLGAVRHLVAMMSTESEPRHYAGLALLKLADNFENHIAIAEEGGIQALLKLGRSRAIDGEVQHKAALTVGTLASRAVEAIPESSNLKGSKSPTKRRK